MRGADQLADLGEPRAQVRVAELRVGALGAAVGALNGPEELLLESIGLLVVELLIRGAQPRNHASA